MRARPVLAILLVALVLASLAIALPGPRGASGSPLTSPAQETQPPEAHQRAALHSGSSEITLAAATWSLSPTQPEVRVPVRLPEGTVRVVYNLTLETGAAASFGADLRGCRFDASLAPGTGVTIGKDCGGVPDGETELVLSHTAGLLSGRAEVHAIVCHFPEATCHALPPAQS